ncbi:MAG: EamA family transporter [Actinomycetes bacterium]
MARSVKSLTWINLWTVYIIWGSTYFAIAIAVKSMPSLLGMGIRFLGAGTILGLVLIIKNGWRALAVPKREIISASLLGALLLGFGIGNVSLAEHTVPSSIVALIISAMPFWIAIFRAISGDHPAKLSWFGVILGFAGVAVLLKPGQVHAMNGASNSKLLFWMIMVLVGNIGWAFGTFISPKLSLPKNALVLTTYEMFTGGLSLFIVGLLRGEHFSHFSQTSSSSWWALVYLILIGSIVAYSAYLWLASNAPVSLTATYAYVNPVIAVFLGSFFLHEKIGASIFLGGAIVITGVILVITAESRSKS